MAFRISRSHPRLGISFPKSFLYGFRAASSWRKWSFCNDLDIYFILCQRSPSAGSISLVWGFSLAVFIIEVCFLLMIFIITVCFLIVQLIIMME